MSTHRATQRRSGCVTSVRVRAVLGLGAALGIGATSTLAAWTDDVVISGTTFTSGTLDLRVNGADSIPAYTALNLSNMVPGNSVAALLTVSNVGTSTLKYRASSAATDTVVGKNLAAALTVKVTADPSVTGTGLAKTCAGVALTGSGTSLTGSLIATGRQLAPTGTETLCVQVTLNSSAPTELQGGGTTATLTFTGTSDLS